MKILYISDHAILEYDEVKLFTDMGHEVFSLGAYHNLGHADLPRPKIPNLKYQEYLDKRYVANPNRTNLDERIIAWADCIIVMHAPEVLFQNWDRIKEKKVIWRSIGQSVSHLESRIKPLIDQGLIVVRYSPKEKNIKNFAGESAMIRFYKDPEEYKDWTGETEEVVSFVQSLKGRRDFTHYDEIFRVVNHFKGKLYGSGNEDLGDLNGGQVTYQKQLEIMKRARVFIYAGTWPAAYTLSFMESCMLGIPVVSVSKAVAHVKNFEFIDFFEVDEMLAEIGGAVCDDANQMIRAAEKFIKDKSYADEISKRQRELALKYFDKKIIQKQWQQLLS